MTQPERSRPKVTVGVPTYNRANHLRRAIEMILAQDLQDFELLISDDASTDATPDVVGRFRDSRVIYSRNSSNLKIPGNLNRILDQARGEYIVMLHDHDTFDRSLLSRMVRVLDSEPGVGLVFSAVAWTDHTGGGYRALVGALPERMNGRDLVRTMLASPSFSCPVNACGMVRRSVYDAVGSYDPLFGFLSDVDMWFRVGLHTDVAHIREPLLVCTEREPGHEFGGLNWKVIRWSIDIQRTNLTRYCAHRPEEVDPLCAELRKKTNALLVSGLLSAIGSGQRDLWEEGMRHVREYGTGAIRVLEGLLGIVPASGPLLAIGPLAKNLRRRWRAFARAS